jgi:hypothetical protein
VQPRIPPKHHTRKPNDVTVGFARQHIHSVRSPASPLYVTLACRHHDIPTEDLTKCGVERLRDLHFVGERLFEDTSHINEKVNNEAFYERVYGDPGKDRHI